MSARCVNSRSALVLVGAGHAHARVLLDLARRPAAGTDVTLISPAPLAPYSGMVPGWMAGHYRWEECCIDFGALCRNAGATFRTGSVTALDPGAAVLHLEHAERLTYDVLSLDIGATACAPQAGKLLVLPMRPLSRLGERWDELRADVCARAPGSAYRVLMIGGGAAGVETMLATRHQLAQWAPQLAVEYVLATRDDSLLPTLTASAARKIGAHFDDHGMRIVHGFEAAHCDDSGVVSRDGARLEADVVLWATGPKAHAWPCASGLAHDSAGFIKVDDKLRSVSHPNIFASGDCASFEAPVPKAGVFAVRMGPVLSQNLVAQIKGGPLKRFVPQRRYLVLIGTGGEHAVAAWGPFSLQGRWVWRWKRSIDLGFLEQYKVRRAHHAEINEPRTED